MALADRLVILEGGRIAGVGRPRDLYHSPPTRFVASFLGRSNSLTATVVGVDPPAVALGDTTVTIPELPGTGDLEPGATVTCHVRPEHVALSDTGEATPADTGLPDTLRNAEERALTLAGEVARVTDAGHHYDVTVQSETGAALLVETATAPPPPGASVTLSVARDSLTVFD